MYMLYIPAENVSMIDEAASLIHAMNANTFTGAAFHLTDAGNADGQQGDGCCYGSMVGE